MARRADPERIYAAKRAGTVARYTSRVGAERAERLMAGWETEADARGLVRGQTPFWSDANAWFQEQLKPKPEGPRPGFEEIELDLTIVPTVEQGIADAKERRKELSAILLMAGAVGKDAPIFRETLALSSFINRAVSLHDGVVSGVGQANAHATFTLLRAYSELVVLVYYLGDHPEYLDILEKPPQDPDIRKKWSELFEHAAPEMPGIRSVYAMLSEMAHFGSTAMWNPFHLEDPDDRRLNFTTYPRWKVPDRDPRVALTMLLEADVTTIAVLERYAERHLVPDIEKYNENSEIRAAMASLGAKPPASEREIGTPSPEVAEAMFRAGLMSYCEQHDALETVEGVRAAQFTEFARAWLETHEPEQ
jgi:hypothetical protein